MIDRQTLNNDSPLLTFIHANGYPLAAYQPFLKPLSEKYQVIGYPLRPFWPGLAPAELSDWRGFRDDYLVFLDGILLNNKPKKGSPGKNKVIAVGHSVGAMTSLLAAIQCPGSFQSLVLIEPVLFSPWRGRLMAFLSSFKFILRLHPLIRKTLRRKRSFPDQVTMFNNFRSKPIFSRFSDEVLTDYVNGLSRDLPDGSIELNYSPEWEARIYETSGIADQVVWKNLINITCPVLVIRGNDTDTLNEKVFKRMLERLPEGQGATIAGAGHLAPLEKPKQISELTIQFLDSIQGR